MENSRPCVNAERLAWVAGARLIILTSINTWQYDASTFHNNHVCFYRKYNWRHCQTEETELTSQLTVDFGWDKSPAPTVHRNVLGFRMLSINLIDNLCQLAFIESCLIIVGFHVKDQIDCMFRHGPIPPTQILTEPTNDAVLPVLKFRLPWTRAHISLT